jgi:hypothetical protein
MLEQILALAQDQLGGKLKEVGLNSNQVSQSMEVTKDSITDTLIGQVTGGNISGVLDLFNGKAKTDSSNPVVKQLLTTLTQNLAQKLGLSPQISQTASTAIVSVVMEKFADEKTGTAQNEGDLLKKLGLDSNSAISGIAKNLLGDKADDLLGGISKFF